MLSNHMLSPVPCPANRSSNSVSFCPALQTPTSDHKVISVAFDDATKRFQILSLFSYLSNCSFCVLIFVCYAQWVLEWGAGWDNISLHPPVCIPAIQRMFPLDSVYVTAPRLAHMFVSSLNICQALAKCQLLCTGVTFTKTALIELPPSTLLPPTPPQHTREGFPSSEP